MTFFVLFLKSFLEVKLPALRVRLPGNELSFLIVPLDPAYPDMAGRGTLPACWTLLIGEATRTTMADGSPITALHDFSIVSFKKNR